METSHLYLNCPPWSDRGVVGAWCPGFSLSQERKRIDPQAIVGQMESSEAGDLFGHSSKQTRQVADRMNPE
ncbi:hypothetical protein R1flu_016217 [Riccia fluitans]|uniref:Uncharacterized protein n=1 Tax=Riccia fluitans TaxID=41844 RepID=A0ABD1YL69_9MARC